MQINEIINIKRYPLNDLNSNPGERLIRRVRSSLSDDGSCTLDHFISNQALAIMAMQARSLVDQAFPGPTKVTPYFFNYQLGQELTVADDHPIKRKGKRNLRQVASDLIPSEHLLSRLFYSQLMTDFLSKVVGMPIYQNQDKYQSLNISVMESGGCQQWHFDSGDMVTTLLLQQPESGGVFEYAPNIRSENNENFDQVKDVLDGRTNQIKQLHLKAGMLSLFRGHYSIHRVTEVTGTTNRLQAILGYSTKPNLNGDLNSSILHYGARVAGQSAS